MKSLVVFACALPLLAAPVLQELSPRGIQRGKTFTLYLRGDGLLQNAQLRSTLPATFARLTLSQDPLSENRPQRPDSVLPFLVTLKADTPTGFYPVRVVTPEGISNVLLFTVGDLPEVDEAESKDPRQLNDKEPQKVDVPVVINGKLGPADLDNYRFRAKAGQKLVFEVEARRAGSAIDPAIEIFDSAGREMARNDDAPGLGVDSRLEVTFPKEGAYRLQIHDSKFSDQTQNFYRLKIGQFAYADSLFPLGWRKGEPIEVTLLGGNLPKPVKLQPDGPLVRVPGSTSLPLPFVLGDQPEMLEPDAGVADLPENTIMNGRIAKPGEIDRYRVRVAAGQRWVFEMAAASLGTSRLDALVTIYDAAGKKLASGDDGDGFDPVLPFTVPKGVQEITLAVEDLLGRGGGDYGYRLWARQQHPDFVADLITPFVNVPAGGTAQVAVNIQRRGYDGEIRLRIPNLPAGFTVEGGHVPSEAAAQNFNDDNAGRRSARSILTITAAPDVKPQAVELQIEAVAQTEDGAIRRYARGPGMITAIRGDRRPFTAPWLGMQLPMAVTSPSPLTITPVTPLAHFAQGFEFELRWEIKRDGAMKSPAKVNLQIAGNVGNLRILKGKTGDNGSFLVNTNFATPVTTFDVILEAQTEVDGKPVTITSQAIPIQVAPGYEVKLARSTLEIAPGATAQIPGTVRREPTFEGGLIRIQAEDLPDNVKCPAVEVAAEQKDFVLACEATPSAKAGAFEIRIASVAPDTGRKAKADYKIPDLSARLMVKSQLAASK